MNHVKKARPALTSDHGRNTSKNHVRKTCPTLTSDHGRNTSKTHVRKAQHSHPTSTCQKGSALTFDLILLKSLCTYIRPHLVRKALHLHPNSSYQKGSALTSDHGRTRLPPCQKGFTLTFDPVRNALHLHLTMGGPTYHRVRKAHRLITSPRREPRYGEHQASP